MPVTDDMRDPGTPDDATLLDQAEAPYEDPTLGVVIQTDNGSEFQQLFHWHLVDRGIQHVHIRPATPRLNGKVERSHRIDADEFYRMLAGVVIDDTRLFNDKLQEWENFYNYHRPHGALGGQTPYERLRQKTKA
jgi:transposase InsO family protein